MRLLTKGGGYARLLSAILLSLILQPVLVEHLGHARAFGVGFFMLVLFAALEATEAARRARVALLSLAMLAIATSWISFLAKETEFVDDNKWLEGFLAILDHATSIMFLTLVVALIIRRTLAPGRITTARIAAAICAYLLLGILWAEIYRSLEVAYGSVLSSGAGTTDATFVYFSFATLTTLGYGDIAPLHTSARVMAYLEAVTGVLYLATLVARLVALHIAHEQPPAQGDDGGGAQSGQAVPSPDKGDS